MGTREIAAFAALLSAAGASNVLRPQADAASAPSSPTGMPCTLWGTSHADRIVGTKHRDVICELGGD